LQLTGVFVAASPAVAPQVNRVVTVEGSFDVTSMVDGVTAGGVRLQGRFQ
jgi:hypothetical protein